MPITLQNSDGVVFWDDVVYFNPIDDHIVIREGEGQQMELPLLMLLIDSDVGVVQGLLFGGVLSMFGLSWFVGRRDEDSSVESF